MGELADPGKRSSNLVKWADEVGRGLVKIKCFNVEDEATSLTEGKYQICDHLDGGGNGEQKKGKKFEVGETSRSRDDEGRQEALTSCRRVTAWDRVGKEKKIHKRIERADEVGRDLLKTIRSNEDDEGTIPASGKGNNREPNEITNDGQLQSKSQGRVAEGLTPISSATNPQLPYPHSPPSQPTRRRTPPHRPVKRCYRCLASDHTVATCRDPVRCYRCGKTGHRAHYCKRKFGANAGMMNRAVNHRGRAPVAKVFVPYTDEYFRRVELRRNAILADVIQPANLGPDPISTIKTALASRFGGYKEDFAVARSRERHFVIFLPEWVPAAVLIRREVLTLNDFWIRCWPWGRYRDARPHRVQYKAWIRLINLPFEIWSVARVASLISGFGRFIKADDETKALTDFRAFRCQIALDSINNIPRTSRSSSARSSSRSWSTSRGGKGQWKGELQHRLHHHATEVITPRRERTTKTRHGTPTENTPKTITTWRMPQESWRRLNPTHEPTGPWDHVGNANLLDEPPVWSGGGASSSSRRRRWVATGRRSSDFDATGALGSRPAERRGTPKPCSNLESGPSTPKPPCLTSKFLSDGQLPFLSRGLTRKKECIHARDGELEAAFTPLGQLSGLEPKKLTLASKLSGLEPKKLTLASRLVLWGEHIDPQAHGSARSLSLGHPGLLHMTYGSAFLMYGGSIGRPASLSSVCFSKKPEELSICFSEESEEPRPTTISPLLTSRPGRPHRPSLPTPGHPLACWQTRTPPHAS
uniref:CCHC-type domain-containing protein n=1 Tax=Ananas comosus var. bracteatus TaxID=296719 RepID=A0A6V7PN60_ANACO|nr:unnamed protein product [Ananas comosus var. bracteatus]